MALGCSVSDKPCRECGFCSWKREGFPLEGVSTDYDAPIGLHETKRLCAIIAKGHRKIKTSKENTGTRQIQVRAHPKKKIKIEKITQSKAHERLHRFLRLLHHMDKAPWANIVFAVNDKMIRRLVASHLHLIVGKEEFKKEGKAALYHIIDSEMRLDGSQNLVWITNRFVPPLRLKLLGNLAAAPSVRIPTVAEKGRTLGVAHKTPTASTTHTPTERLGVQRWRRTRAARNTKTPHLLPTLDVLRVEFRHQLVVVKCPAHRQQGKTSTMGKFIAALSIASPHGGQLANVYSTSLDRAIELVKAARQYTDWMMTDQGHHPEWQGLTYTKNSYNTYSITCPRTPTPNDVIAKPKNPDSCRGDAPAAAFFDEIGFMTENFWYKFALPLLQVTQRIATCTTTPPPADSFFAAFVDKVKQRNEKGDFFFHLENHSLSCQACIDLDEADQCCHNLHYIPP